MDRIVGVSEILRTHLWRFTVYSLLIWLTLPCVLLVAETGKSEYLSLHIKGVIILMAGLSTFLWGLACWASWYSPSPFWKIREANKFWVVVRKILNYPKPGYFSFISLISWLLIALFLMIFGIIGL